MAPRFGIVVFLGSNCEQDVMHAVQVLGFKGSYLWHQDTSVAGYDAIVLPGGFSYGDYLRCGAVARLSPIMDEVLRFAAAGGPVLGICNGFQILCEAQLLPGALIRNRGLKFICEPAHLRVEGSVCQWVAPELAGSMLTIPINHNEGNYFCDPHSLEQMRQRRQIVLRYVLADGTSSPDAAPNGALDNIAGICNEQGNVFGLMPHPERVVDGISGGRDGAALFSYLATRMVGA